ncbi:hypothetical protein OL229_09400 [Neisseriaceae bacterium JH1-16]|nr:hypothetical protein [Neisseriaceae bacterium JH1-16]
MLATTTGLLQQACDHFLTVIQRLAQFGKAGRVVSESLNHPVVEALVGVLRAIDQLGQFLIPGCIGGRCALVEHFTGQFSLVDSPLARFGILQPQVFHLARLLLVVPAIPAVMPSGYRSDTAQFLYPDGRSTSNLPGMDCRRVKDSPVRTSKKSPVISDWAFDSKRLLDHSLKCVKFSRTVQTYKRDGRRALFRAHLRE